MTDRGSERADVLAYLRSRLRVANSVADRNPGEAERAIEIIRSITIEIEAIEQGLHEGAAQGENEMSMGVYDV